MTMVLFFFRYPPISYHSIYSIIATHLIMQVRLWYTIFNRSPSNCIPLFYSFIDTHLSMVDIYVPISRDTLSIISSYMASSLIIIYGIPMSKDTHLILYYYIYTLIRYLCQGGYHELGYPLAIDYVKKGIMHNLIGIP